MGADPGGILAVAVMRNSRKPEVPKTTVFCPVPLDRSTGPVPGSLPRVVMTLPIAQYLNRSIHSKALRSYISSVRRGDRDSSRGGAGRHVHPDALVRRYLKRRGRGAVERNRGGAEQAAPPEQDLTPHRSGLRRKQAHQRLRRRQPGVGHEDGTSAVRSTSRRYSVELAVTGLESLGNCTLLAAAA